MAHTPWSPRLAAVLARWGAAQATIDRIRERQARLCAPAATVPLLRATPRVQAALFAWGVDPQAVYEIVAYLDELNERRLSPEQPAEQRARKRVRDAQGKRKWREEHRDDYNAYQRELMRKRRAAQRALDDIGRARTERARAARRASDAPA